MVLAFNCSSPASPGFWDATVGWFGEGGESQCAEDASKIHMTFIS